jgi:Mrp family chromosome partitioning ATPase
MTRALPFTEHSMRRAITAARKAGLRVTGIRANGTLFVQDSADPVAELAAQAQPSEAPSKWADVEA